MKTIAPAGSGVCSHHSLGSFLSVHIADPLGRWISFGFFGFFAIGCSRSKTSKARHRSTTCTEGQVCFLSKRIGLTSLGGKRREVLHRSRRLPNKGLEPTGYSLHFVPAEDARHPVPR